MPPASVGPDRRTDAGCREPAVTSFRDNSRRLQLLAVTASLSLFAQERRWRTQRTSRLRPRRSRRPRRSHRPPLRREHSGRSSPGRHRHVARNRSRPVRAPARRHQNQASPAPHVVRPRRTGAVLAETTGASRESYAFALTVAALSLAIACFAVGSVPAAQVPSRRGAAFSAYRRTDVTVVGFVCLVAAAIVHALAQDR